jgi:hypothetical protein
MQLSAQEFLKRTGLEESLSQGQIKFKHHRREKAGASYTMVYDWKTDPYKIRVEVRPGLNGLMPEGRELSKHALWLQAETFAELDLSHLKTAH